MRAKEFTINIPINISMNADGSVDVDTPQQDNDEATPEENPVMVAPLQQSIEMQKAGQGKDSPVIDTLTTNSEIGSEEEEPETIGAEEEEEYPTPPLGV